MASAEIEGEIANEHASAPRAVNKMQWSLMRSFMVTFSSDSDEILDVVGAIREKTDVADERGKMLKREDCKPHNGHSCESETASRNASCSGCVSSAQLPDLFLQRLCPPMGEIASQKTSRTTTVGAEFSSKKNGFQLMCKLLLS